MKISKLIYLALVVTLFSGCKQEMVPNTQKITATERILPSPIETSNKTKENLENTNNNINNSTSNTKDNKNSSSIRETDATNKSGNEDVSPNITIKTGSTSMENISSEIFKAYLEGFKEPKNSKFTRISDYQIKEIKIVKGDLNQFEFSVTYSVFPTSNEYPILANGEKDNSGWVVNKVFFVKVKKDNRLYKIDGMATDAF